MESIGLSKTIFNSAVCRMKNCEDVEIFLTERLLRKKASGAWPQAALQKMMANADFTEEQASLCENRDLDEPLANEIILNSRLPFVEFLKQENLLAFSQLTNPKLPFMTHHLAHAYSAAFVSPFERSLILVIDGAGSRRKLFPESHSEYHLAKLGPANPEAAEERTLYTFDQGRLICVDKRWQEFQRSEKHQDHYFSEGLGSFYEKIAEYIFNSKRAAGKVMGLAPYAKANQKIANPAEYLESLDWTRSFQGQSKIEWESANEMSQFSQIAANVQNYFEENLFDYLKQARELFPKYDNLILVGGCALNCTTNMKIFKKDIFSQIYVPPFPSDEGISLGVAYAQHYQATGEWKVRPFADQTAFFGPRSSQPDANEIISEFAGFQISKPASIVDYCARVLAEGSVIAWFQGRSESGPRALGHRSILMRPDFKGAKQYLNDKIKFREQFRPYGCSVLFEKASEYFEVPRGFDNPFMSFAVHTRAEYLQSLKEVTHVDGTSRMQTVRASQDPKFYNLIQQVGNATGIHCLLNTSLNIMGEPIVENVADARKFLESTSVHGLAVGDFYVRKA